MLFTPKTQRLLYLLLIVIVAVAVTTASIAALAVAAPSLARSKVDALWGFVPETYTSSGSRTLTPARSMYLMAPTDTLTLTLGAGLEGDKILFVSTVTTNTIFADTGAIPGGAKTLNEDADAIAFTYDGSEWVLDYFVDQTGVNFDGQTLDFSGATITGLGEYFTTDESGNSLVTGTLTVSGATVFTSAATALAGVDLNGAELTLDANADTSITADTNDQIDVEINGADDFQFTANTFTALSGSTIKANTIAETTGNNGVAVDGVVLKDSGVDLGAAGVLNVPVNVEHIGAMSILTATIPYTPATGAVFTVTDGEIWLVHSLFIQTTTNFDCTGNDCTLTMGDGNDANGFIDANDAALQAAFTEATGYAAGFYGIEAGSGGAYTLDDGGPFVYAPSGADETIDYAVAGTDPAAGQATAYIVYTRIQ